ncbi:potassium-transporting ATPase subunit C [Asticcacaulis solisilvae]|uniref:potassium-transporting ATPase subunit C n=1 Tax=Asticcacaulis solisilvae TaxID=1217274 RepID=UPI003FD888AB
MPVIVQSLRPGLVLLALLAAAAGGLYPLLVRALTENGLNAQLDPAVLRDRSGHIAATSLSGAMDEAPGHVWGRIRTPATVDCDRIRDTPACAAAVTARQQALKRADPSAGPVPSELLSFDGAGLDPAIGINAAHYQAPRIARARHLSEMQVNALIDAAARNAIYNTTRGVTVNRLDINRRLDEQHP